METKEEIAKLMFIYLGREPAKVFLDRWEGQFTDEEFAEKAKDLLQAVTGRFAFNLPKK